MSDTQQSIGKKLVGGEGRDAVHIAICPVIAGDFLRVGDKVKFTPGSTDTVVRWEYEKDAIIGVIDPFLDCYYIAKGERCWMFLLPNSITGLRHVWTHPAFPEQQASSTPPAISEQAFAEHWLRGFADRYSTGYDTLIAGAISGEGVCFGEDLEYGDFNYGSEFWKYLNIVTGRTFSQEHVDNTHFRCAC